MGLLAGKVAIVTGATSGMGRRTIESVGADAFDAAFATLVRSVMLGMKHVAPVMMAQGSGSITDNGSVARCDEAVVRDRRLRRYGLPVPVPVPAHTDASSHCLPQRDQSSPSALPTGHFQPA